MKPFRERLDAMTLACGRTPQQTLRGEERLTRVGECIVADGRLPCQHQPLRGLSFPSRGEGPSTWSLKSPERATLLAHSCAADKRPSLLFKDAATTTCPAGPSFIPSSWGGRIRHAPNRVKVDFVVLPISFAALPSSIRERQPSTRPMIAKNSEMATNTPTQ